MRSAPLPGLVARVALATPAVLVALLLLAAPALALPGGAPAPPPGAEAVGDCDPLGPAEPFANCAVFFAYRAANDAFFAAYRTAMCLAFGC